MNILSHLTPTNNCKLDNSFYLDKKLKLLSPYGRIKLEFLVLSELDSYFKFIALKAPSYLSNSKTVLSKRIVKSLVFLSRYLMNSGSLLRCITSVNKVLSNSFIRILKKSASAIYRGEAQALSKKPIVSLSHKTFSSRHTQIFSQLNHKLLSLKPLFYFYIYKVDKQIYKNSRGKSGKYTFL